MRALASVLVVLYHITSNNADKNQFSFLGGIFEFGGAGVDIFFVISGFIITYTNKLSIQNKKNASVFLERRFLRIYPIYWVIISGFLLVAYSMPQYYNMAFDYSISNVSGTYLLLPGHQMVNGVSWTLSFELYFYLIFILVFFIRNKSFLWGLAGIYLLTIFTLPLFTDPATLSAPIHLAFHPMIIEFFLGIVIALPVKKTPRNTAKYSMLTGIVLFITGAYLYNMQVIVFPPSYAEFTRVLLFGLPSFFMMLGIVMLDLKNNPSVNKYVVLLGEASYTLYLIHLPIVAAVVKLTIMAGIKNSLMLHAIFIALTIIVCMVSIITYLYIEKPMISMLKRNRQMV